MIKIMRRRRFVKWVLGLFASAAIARCSQEAPANDRSFTSNVSSGHDHSVTITQESWNNPPSGGQSYITTTNYKHTHTVALSYDQLQLLAQGYQITATTNASDHDHTFTLLLTET